MAPAVTGGVTKFLLTHDLSTLLVAGNDGSLVLFDVKDSEGRPLIQEGSLRLPWLDDVQTSIFDLETSRANLLELKEAVNFAHKTHMNSDQQRRDGAFMSSRGCLQRRQQQQRHEARCFSTAHLVSLPPPP